MYNVETFGDIYPGGWIVMGVFLGTGATAVFNSSIYVRMSSNSNLLRKQNADIALDSNIAHNLLDGFRAAILLD